MSTVLFRGAVVLPNGLLEDGAVLCIGGRIAAVGAGAEVETPPGALEIDGAFVAPGFVHRRHLKLPRAARRSGRHYHHVAGTGEAGYSGDGGPATEVRLRPEDIAIGQDGCL